MVALHSGVGQVVDVSLLESMFQIMGPLISLYRLTGELQPRLGAGLPYTVPARDVPVQRRQVGRPLGQLRQRRGPRRPRCSASATTRASRRSRTGWRNRDALEAVMVDWCAARPQDEVLPTFTAADAAIGPVMDMADIAADPHYAAREAIVDRRRHADAGARSPSSAPRPARCAGPAAPSTPTATHIRGHGWA